jgi:hypothetical protein
MKSFNSTSLQDSQSNIVPFQSAVRSKFRYASQQASVWERFWDGLFNLLMPSSQPVITQKRAQDGSYYQVYDPTTQTTQTFASELETRIWLDRRFYDSPRNL